MAGDALPSSTPHNTRENDRENIDKFPDLQERLDYQEGWTGSESTYDEASRKLVKAAKDATQTEIQAAWDKGGKSGNADPHDTHPAIDAAVLDCYLPRRACSSVSPTMAMALCCVSQLEQVMIDIRSRFDAFLDEISLGQTQVDRIESASNTLRDFVKEH